MSLIDYVKDNYVLYVLGSQENIKGFCMNPFGMSAHYINPLLTSSKQFVDLLIQLDGISYGDKKMGMEKWVALDCGMLPSAFVGLAKKNSSLEKSLKKKFEIPENYDCLIPVSMYCAIPSAKQGLWISHSLATAEQGKGLGLLTKLLGIKIFGAKELIGIAQYDNHSVKIHAKISDLKIISALTFAHSIPEMTFVYRHEIDQDKLEEILNYPAASKKHSFLLKADDYKTKQKMQQEIESGTTDFFIIPPGQIKLSGEIYVPIREVKK
ncbi:hypothetical protein HZA97_01555 [Candidatus Woesearchaeota archaeon]|nr:hypothetical protein [Candidatus Woesearchaeota archaeon]